MKIFFVLCAFILSGSLSHAAESVGSSPIKKIGTSNDVFDSKNWKAYPEVEKFVEKKVLKDFRSSHGCLGPNAEKDAPAFKKTPNSMSCSDLLTYDGAMKKSADIGSACKEACAKSAMGKTKATGKSAAALAKCMNDACEKECDFKNLSFKTEVDAFIRGSVDQHGDDAASM